MDTPTWPSRGGHLVARLPTGMVASWVPLHCVCSLHQYHEGASLWWTVRPLWKKPEGRAQWSPSVVITKGQRRLFRPETRKSYYDWLLWTKWQLIISDDVLGMTREVKNEGVKEMRPSYIIFCFPFSQSLSLIFECDTMLSAPPTGGKRDIFSPFDSAKNICASYFWKMPSQNSQVTCVNNQLCMLLPAVLPPLVYPWTEEPERRGAVRESDVRYVPSTSNLHTYNYESSSDAGNIFLVRTCTQNSGKCTVKSAEAVSRPMKQRSQEVQWVQLD